MSYWISLNDPETGEPATVANFQDGGTQVIGGSNEADLNVTYNYSRHFNFRELHGKKGKDTIQKMQEAVHRLGTKTDDDYWKSTQGNAGHAVNILLSWARQFPEYIWDVN